MGMICWLLGLSPSQIAALRANPSLASDLARVSSDDQLQASRAAWLSRRPPEQRATMEADYRAAREAFRAVLKKRTPALQHADAQLDAARRTSR